MLRLFVALLLALPLFAAQQNDFRMEVLVDGSAVPEYPFRGVTYVEALKGKEYAIRLTNPLGVRVAVTLSVDGLNTIDARHTDARAGQKWVLDPYQTITLYGWQVSGRQARRFFFTTEENSYGQWLGRTENLGVISAAFFRERVPYYDEHARIQGRPAAPRPAPQADSPAGAGASAESRGKSAARDEYAATGIGDRISHPVTRVYLDLEDRPASVVTLRYEFRPALMALGVLPRPQPAPDPLSRRERARGFRDAGFCPQPR